MKLDEAITVSSVERFVDRRKVSMAAGTAASIGVLAAGLTLPIGLAIGLVSGVAGVLIDFYLNGKQSKKELERLNLLVRKRSTIIEISNKTGKLKGKYIHSVLPTLKKMKLDIDAIANHLLKGAIKARAKASTPEDQQKIDTLINALNEVKKSNKRPLKESVMVESLALIPIAFVSIMYMRDKLSLNGTLKKIEKIYLMNIEEDVDSYFHELEYFVWGYLTDAATHYYRGFITKEEFEQQSNLAVNIITTKDISILFNQ